MSEADKKAIAAHLYIMMRRSANRVIDVEWLSKNDEYAKEIIELARSQGQDELTRYADRFDELIGGVAKPTPVVAPIKSVFVDPMTMPANMEEDAESEEEVDASRYIGSLR